MLVILLLGVQAVSLIGLTPTVQASTVTFANTINLSNDSVPSGLPALATSGKYVYAAWLNNSCADCKSDVLFRASADNGTSFASTIKLSSTVNGDAENLQIAAVGTNVYVVWQANVSLTVNDVFFRKSIDNGATFAGQVDLTGGINNAVDSEFPQVSAAGNNVTVAWWLVTTSHNNPNTIVEKTSINGASFGSLLTLSSNANPALSPDSGPKTAEVGKYVYITWRDGNSKMFLTVSNNGGSTFAFVPAANIAGTVTTDNDIYPAIAATGNNVYVTWTNDSSACPVTCSNTMFRASTNNGAAFGSIMNLYSNSQITDLNPAIAATGNSVHVVWTNNTGTGPQILLRTSTNQGSTFNPVKNLSNAPVFSNQQVISAIGSSVFIAWDESSSSTNEVFFSSSNDNGATFVSQDLSPTVGNGLSPMPAIGASGPNVYVAWQDDTQGNGDIFFRGNGAPPAIPDVAITAVNVSRTFAYSAVAAKNLTVSVTAMNLGNVAASFTVGANATNTNTRANVTIGNKQTVMNLGLGASQVLQFSWNTAPLSTGNYSITAYASIVAGETNLSNNVKSCPSSGTGCGWTGMFTSRFKGDVNIAGSGRCLVDIVDLTGVGSTFGKSIGQLGYSSAADLNNDGIIDVSDLVVVASSFGQFLTPCPY